MLSRDIYIELEIYNSLIDGLVQEKHNYIANALELRLSCTNPSKYGPYVHMWVVMCCQSVFTRAEMMYRGTYHIMYCIVS